MSWTLVRDRDISLILYPLAASLGFDAMGLDSRSSMSGRTRSLPRSHGSSRLRVPDTPRVSPPASPTAEALQPRFVPARSAPLRSRHGSDLTYLVGTGRGGLLVGTGKERASGRHPEGASLKSGSPPRQDDAPGLDRMIPDALHQPGRQQSPPDCHPERRE